MADSVRMGSASIQSRNAGAIYDRWRKGLEREIDRLEGNEKPVVTIWEGMRKGKGKKKIG